MASTAHTIVLDHDRIQLIIERFAHEIYEMHHDKKKLTLIGIEGRGMALCKRLANHLEDISKLDITVEEIGLHKSEPTKHEVKLSCELSALRKQSVILIDDVLNSGRTLVYALRHLLGESLTSVTTVVLVDRIHRKFPVRADIVGMTLSTTLQERVEVEFGAKRDFAYLV